MIDQGLGRSRGNLAEKFASQGLLPPKSPYLSALLPSLRAPLQV